MPAAPGVQQDRLPGRERSAGACAQRHPDAVMVSARDRRGRRRAARRGRGAARAWTRACSRSSSHRGPRAKMREQIARLYRHGACPPARPGGRPRDAGRRDCSRRSPNAWCKLRPGRRDALRPGPMTPPAPSLSCARSAALSRRARSVRLAARRSRCSRPRAPEGAAARAGRAPSTPSSCSRRCRPTSRRPRRPAPTTLAWRHLQAGDPRRASAGLRAGHEEECRRSTRGRGAGWAAPGGARRQAGVVRRSTGPWSARRSTSRRSWAAARRFCCSKDERAALAAFESALGRRAGVARRAAARRGPALPRARGTAGRRAVRPRRRARWTRRGQAYARALELSPDSPLVYRELAEVERQAGDLAVGAGARAARRPASTRRTGRRSCSWPRFSKRGGKSGAAIDAYLQAQALDAAPDIAAAHRAAAPAGRARAVAAAVPRPRAVRLA